MNQMNPCFLLHYPSHLSQLITFLQWNLKNSGLNFFKVLGICFVNYIISLSYVVSSYGRPPAS